MIFMVEQRSYFSTQKIEEVKYISIPGFQSPLNCLEFFRICIMLVHVYC